MLFNLGKYVQKNKREIGNSKVMIDRKNNGFKYQ